MSRIAAQSRLGLVLLLFAASGFAALKHEASDTSTVLVSTEWVAQHLNSENLILLHVGSGYDEGHIPGARLLESSMIARTIDGLSLQLLPAAELKANLEALGISDDSRIVLYTTNWMTMTGRVYVTLDYLGLGDRTSIMDGGLTAWKAEGRPLTTQVPAASRGHLTPQPNPALIASAAWVDQNLDNPRVKVIDARTPNFYSGARGGHGQPRAGHIAGAGNVPFSSVVDEETMKFKSADQLQAMFEAAGAKRGDEVVTYCHIGQQASLVFVAAKLAGYDAALYDGSFQEWSNLEEFPVERPALATMPKLISTQELAALIDDEPVTVLDVRSSLNDYLAGHIPGAAYVHYESLRATRAGVPADLLSAESYAALFSELGVARDRPVVIYSDGDRADFNATFVAWILDGFSHPKIRLLDGGYAKWTADGLPTSRLYPETQPTEFSAEGFDPSRANLQWVKWVVDHAGTEDAADMLLVDVRPADQFEGRAGPQLRRGHIPGAINHLWSSDLEAGGGSLVWKPTDQLLADYEAQGITRDKHVILYCNTGTEASHAYFALKNLLGYPMVDVYFPSWTEWSEHEELPIETMTASR